MDIRDVSKGTQFKSGAQAVENGRKGGKASAEAKRLKKSMRETLEVLLAMPISDAEIAELESVSGFTKLKGQNLTVNDAILVKQVQKALKGDLRAAEFVRDSIGQKPSDRLDLAAKLGPVVLIDNVKE